MTPKQILLSIAAGTGLLIIGAVAWAVSQAVATLIAAHPTVFGLLALSAAVIVLLGGARLLLAIGAQQQAKAWQAAIVRLPNNFPAHVLDVPDLAQQLAPTTLDGFYVAEIARAKVSPTLTHLHQEIHAAPPAELLAQLLQANHPPTLTQLPQLGSGGGPQLAQLRQLGHVCRSGNSLLVGYAAGVPQYIELPEAGFIGIGGQPRVGKSVTASLLIDQAVLSGWHVLIGDPHYHKDDGLLKRLRPLSGCLARQAVSPNEIAQMVRLADKIGKRRVQGDPDRTPVIMVIDEFSNLIWRQDLPDDVLAILPSMAAEYAGVGVHGVLIAHDWSKASLGGDLGAALRRTITHRLIHRMDPGNVEFLLPKGLSAQARAVQGLSKGQALYAGPDGAVTVTVPLIGDEDAAYAAQGTPPRPYLPRALPGDTPQQLTSPAVPAAALPPTERLPALTNQEQILVLLEAQPWLTSTEIADRLSIAVELVRVELSTLKQRRALEQRRAVGKSDRFEWSLAKPLYELMALPAVISA